ncbi:helix-turn-helix domain-containing protein, partial [Streptomyces alkaliphilus]
MSDPIDAIEALLEEARPLPHPAERERLRTAAGLTRTRVAGAIGVTPETVRKWETGATDPSGEHRAAYGRLLDGLAVRYP